MHNPATGAMRGRAGDRIAKAAAPIFGLLAALWTITPAAAQDATALLRAAYDNWRATSSETEVTMTVHRPDWQRTMQMKGWTHGNDKALVRFTAPARDAGNATLQDGRNTWVYNPKLNQVIKLPASMMGQSWMGSDFSYNDLAKSEDVLDQYTHSVIGTSSAGGHTVYQIEAIPKRGAPVVWGKLVIEVRDDGILISETFYDQDMQPVRAMTADRIATLGGRPYPVVLTMRPNDNSGNWTRVETTAAKFNIDLPGYLFTTSNLQNPRD